LEDLFIAKRSGRIATTWLSSKYRWKPYNVSKLECV
jgi:hypothetical protein